MLQINEHTPHVTTVADHPTCQRTPHLAAVYVASTLNPVKQLVRDRRDHVTCRLNQCVSGSELSIKGTEYRHEWFHVI